MSIKLFTIEKKDSLPHTVAQGGVLAGITLLLASLGNLFPALELLQYLALTPIIIAGVLRGTPFSLEVAAASALLVGSFWGVFPVGLFFLFSIIPLGVALGYFFRKNTGPRVVFFSSIAILALSLGLLVYISITFFGVDIQKEMQAMAKSMDAFMTAVTNLFISFSTSLFGSGAREKILATAQSFNFSPEYSVRFGLALLPSALFLTALCYSFYIWIFNAFLLGRLGLIEKKKNYFIHIWEFFQFPRSFLLLFLAGLLLFMLKGNEELTPAFLTGMNILCCTSLLLYFRGLFALNVLIRRRLKTFLRLLLFFFSITIGIPFLILGGVIITLFPLEPIAGHR
jgi:hypothetical protein